MWASARGHLEGAIILYRWNPTALNVRSGVGLTAAEAARHHGYAVLAEELERLEACREHDNMSVPTNTTSEHSLETSLLPVPRSHW